MRILFVVTGVGLGDSTRVDAIIDKFKKKHPDMKVLIAGYDTSYEYFRKKYPTVKITGYKIPGDKLKFHVLPFIFRNYLLPFVWFFTALKMRKRIKSFKPDIIVSDFEPSAIAMAKFVKKKCVVIFGLDPNLYEKYKKVHPVNPIMKMQATYFQKIYDQADFVIVTSLNKPAKKNLMYHYVNPIIRTWPKQLPSEEKLMQELGLERKPILVMLGGSNFGASLARNLIKVAPNFNEYFIFFGSNAKLQKAPNVKHFKFSKDFLKYLKVAKGVISLGGQKTLAEAAIYNKPLLIYPIKQHIEQQLNAFSLKDVAMIGNKIHPEALKKQVDEFIERLPELKKKISAFKFKADGADQAIWFIEGLINTK